jgi:hypothetical protein
MASRANPTLTLRIANVSRGREGETQETNARVENDGNSDAFVNAIYRAVGPQERAIDNRALDATEISVFTTQAVTSMIFKAYVIQRERPNACNNSRRQRDIRENHQSQGEIDLAEHI